ncbi:hypothetical protein STEG23_000899 [Scotinomys teguina]
MEIPATFCYPGFFVSPYEVENCSFQVCEELSWDFDGDCIKSVDSFWNVPCIPTLYRHVEQWNRIEDPDINPHSFKATKVMGTLLAISGLLSMEWHSDFRDDNLSDQHQVLPMVLSESSLR